jgi:hypothetical protein
MRQRDREDVLFDKLSDAREEYRKVVDAALEQISDARDKFCGVLDEAEQFAISEGLMKSMDDCDELGLRYEPLLSMGSCEIDVDIPDDPGTEFREKLATLRETKVDDVDDEEG